DLGVEIGVVPAHDVGQEREPVALGQHRDQVDQRPGHAERGGHRLRGLETGAGVDRRVQDEEAEPGLVEGCHGATELVARRLDSSLLAGQLEEGARVALRETPVHGVAPAPLTKSRTKRSWSSGRMARRTCAVASWIESSMTSERRAWRAAPISCSARSRASS